MTILEKRFRQDQLIVEFVVDADQNNVRVDQFIQLYMQSTSRESIKKKIKDGDISIANRTATIKSSTKLHSGDHVTLVINKTTHEDEYWNGEKLELQTTPEIIYEDHHIAVISKPPFMVAHPTGKHIFNCATVYFEAKYNKTIHSIHRIDRETSGVLLLAKDPETAKAITQQFENDLVKKCYFFISQIDQDTFDDNSSFTAFERLDSNEPGLRRVYINSYPKDSVNGKHAQTKFEIVYTDEKYALGLAFPKTGRQHQIRVHAKVHGLPLIGDKLYLGSFEMFQRFKDNIATEEDHKLMQIPRQALHALALNLNYDNQNQTFISEIPHDFQVWIKDNLKVNLKKLKTKMDEIIKDYFA